MIRPYMLPLLLLGTLPAAAAAAPSAPPPATCPTPADLVTATLPLSATAAAIHAGKLRILALGSASILGPGTSGAGAAWPQRLATLLRAGHPGLDVEIEVQIIESALQPPSPALVIWQTGAVEAIRNLPTDDLTDALDAGLAAIHGAGADAILVDQQFSRFLRANTDIDSYRADLRVAAAAGGALLLRRYELMRLWADDQAGLDLEHAPKAKRAAVADRLNLCIAVAMNRLIESGVALAAP
jgi:acyl-CoA thioesterase-1